MIDLSKLTVLVCDCGGLYAEWAIRIGKQVKKCYYYTPNDDPFTMDNRSEIGTGYDEIEVVDNMFYDEDNVDLYIGTDVGLGTDLWHLKNRDHKPVWSSLYAEELECDREKTKKLLKQLGIAVGPYKVFNHVDELEKHLKTVDDGYIKISWFRGQFESRKWKGWQVDHHWFEYMKSRLSNPKRELIWEAPLLNKVEIGVDAYTVLGQWPTKHLAGIEVKDKSYIGIFKNRADFPKQLTAVGDKLSPILQKLGCISHYSDEQRIGKDKISYPIDYTMRCPSPPGEVMMEFYDNMVQIMAEAAINHVCIDPTPKDDAKVVCQIVIRSNPPADIVMKSKQTIVFPEKLRSNVKLHWARRVKPGEFEIIPQNTDLSEIGAVIGWGKTIKQAHDMACDVAKEIKGTYIDIDNTVLDVAEEALGKAANMGLDIQS